MVHNQFLTSKRPAVLNKPSYLLSSMNSESDKHEVTKTWISGQHSATLVIPRSVAVQHGLTTPSHVVVESVSEGQVMQGKGILIRRLDIPEILGASGRKEKSGSVPNARQGEHPRIASKN